MSRFTRITRLSLGVAVAIVLSLVVAGTTHTAGAASGNPLDYNRLYKDPAWPPPGVGAPSAIRNVPVGIWVGGWSDAYSTVRKVITDASAKGQAPVLVAYNIPLRDCGQYSAGGASGSGAYGQWIRSFSAAIGHASAVVILEPDALNGFHCMSESQKHSRLAMLRDAVDVFASSNPHTAVYIDAGHPRWESTSTMASRLRAAGVEKARGFALNVSSFYSTSENEAYGESIAWKLGGKHYVVDTSRNGNGATSDWCNPWHAKVGKRPTTWTGVGNNDAYLWIKRPGESDGNCNGGPPAGQWFNSYAYNLAS